MFYLGNSCRSFGIPFFFKDRKELQPCGVPELEKKLQIMLKEKMTMKLTKFLFFMSQNTNKKFCQISIFLLSHHDFSQQHVFKVLFDALDFRLASCFPLIVCIFVPHPHRLQSSRSTHRFIACLFEIMNSCRSAACERC